MHCTIIGSGTSIISTQRSSPATYIKIGSTQLLVDCGAGTLRQLCKAGIPYQDIDMVCISHYHMDHLSDLFALIWALQWPHFNRTKELIFIGPTGFTRFFNEHVAPLVWKTPSKYFTIEIREIEDKIIFDDFIIAALSTNHTEESLAYKITEENRSLVISGDTDYSQELISFATEADLLILECSGSNEAKASGHLISKECGTIAQKAKVRKLVLTHLYPDSSDSLRLEETQQVFSNTILAEDLMSFAV